MTRYAISTVIPPDVEPVTVEEVKAHAKIDGDDEDELIAGWITTAREAAELYTNRSFITRTLKASVDSSGRQSAWEPGQYQLPVDYFDTPLPGAYSLPRGPVLTISSVTTYDTLNTGAVYPDTNYRLSGNRIVLNAGSTWPSPLRTIGGTEIFYTAGYGPSPADVPRQIRTAISIHAAALYESRGMCECDMPSACLMLLAPYRVTSI